MHYVIDVSHQYVTHIGDERSCREYVRNATELFGAGPYEIVKGAKARDARIKELRG